MLDGSEWGFGLLAGVNRGFKVREGVPFSCGLRGVEIVRGKKLVRRVPLGHQSYRCSQRQGRVRGKGRAMEFSEEEHARGSA
jgi:hypothetical protein